MTTTQHTAVASPEKTGVEIAAQMVQAVADCRILIYTGGRSDRELLTALDHWNGKSRLTKTERILRDGTVRLLIQRAP